MSSISSEEPRKDYKFPMIWLDPVEFDMMDAGAIRAQLTTNKLMTKREIRDFLMDCHESAE